MTASDQLQPPETRAGSLRQQERSLDLDAAADLIALDALVDQPVGGVGIELEGHVFDPRDLSRPVELATLRELQQDWPRLPGGGQLSLEPGGQLEVSSVCVQGAAAAVAATRADVAAVRSWLAERGLGWVLLGADPIRQPRRVNPAPRYAGMQEWFDAEHSGSRGQAGTTMMCSTAAVQVNLDAGRPDQWAPRLDRAQRLAPVLTALTGSSAHLQGSDTGWCSARQRAWSGLDPLTSGPLPIGPDPRLEWVERALAAPVMLLDTPAGLVAAPYRRSLRDWIDHPRGWPPPTGADVRRHLTTLFPPVRLRGWLELRCLDSLPDPWWPAVVAAVVAWMDASEIDEPVAAALAAAPASIETAARDGIGHPWLRTAAETLLGLAVPAVSAALRPGVSALLDLVRDARTPGSVLADEMRRRGSAAVVQELVHD